MEFNSIFPLRLLLCLCRSPWGLGVTVNPLPASVFSVFCNQHNWSGGSGMKGEEVGPLFFPLLLPWENADWQGANLRGNRSPLDLLKSSVLLSGHQTLGPVAGVWVRFWVGQKEAPLKSESTEREIRAFWGAEGGVGGLGALGIHFM